MILKIVVGILYGLIITVIGLGLVTGFFRSGSFKIILIEIKVRVKRWKRKIIDITG